MKKTIEKLICIIIAGVMLFAVGCSNRNEGNNSQNSGSGNESNYNNESDIGHESEVIIEPTANNIVDKKKSSYKILIPDNAETNEEKAASELSYFLHEATEVSLPIISDAKAQTSGKYISIGNTSVLNNAGLKGLNSELGLEGYRIKTVGDNICIYAATSRGVINGVYGFLQYSLGYEFYYDDVYDLDKVSTLPLYDYDIKDVPDIETRIAGYGYQAYNIKTMQRMRMQKFEDTFAGSTYHNCFAYLPPSTYQSEHPEWYAQHSTVTQLCFTARGNSMALANNANAEQNFSLYI